MARKLHASAFVLLVLAAFVIPEAVPNGHGQLTGVVCIADSSSTSCPTAPVAVSASNGTQIQLAVNIQGSDPLNGFDVFVKADPTVLEAVAINLTGTILGTNTFTAASCIGFTGVGCASGENGPGVVEVAIVAFVSSPSPATGKLFSIIYNVTRSVSNVFVGFQTGCSGTSTTGNYCVTIANGPTGADRETVEETSSSPGDFSISASVQSALVRGSTVNGEVQITSLSGFLGSISLTYTVSPVKKSGPILLPLSSGTIFLLPGTSTLLGFILETFRTTPPGTYTFTLTGTSGGLTRSGSLNIEISSH